MHEEKETNFFEGIDPDWKDFFSGESQKEYFFKLLDFLREEYNDYRCWPEKKNVFRVFRELKPQAIKVVILGQDPYHTPYVADGLAFSSQKENYTPPSLKNILIELSRDLNFSSASKNKNSLLPWNKEGVFLLNTSLTVREGQPLSHLSVWEPFILSLIDYLNKTNKRLVWVFWGEKSRSLGRRCQIPESRSVVSAHPSPYSADRGFFFSRPFSQINQLLEKLGVQPVNWLRIFE